MTFDEWWAVFCREWDQLSPMTFRPPQDEFRDYWEDGDHPKEAVLHHFSVLEEFQ